MRKEAIEKFGLIESSPEDLWQIAADWLEDQGETVLSGVFRSELKEAMFEDNWGVKPFAETRTEFSFVDGRWIGKPVHSHTAKGISPDNGEGSQIDIGYDEETLFGYWDGAGVADGKGNGDGSGKTYFSNFFSTSSHL